MTMKPFVIACAFAIAGDDAHAQAMITGAIQGKVTDKNTGKSLPGVTVLASHLEGVATQIQITDENGHYEIGHLPPGEHLVTFLYPERTEQHRVVIIVAGRATAVFQQLHVYAFSGTVVEFRECGVELGPDLLPRWMRPSLPKRRAARHLPFGPPGARSLIRK